MRIQWMVAALLCGAFGCGDSSKVTASDAGGSLLTPCDGGPHFAIDPKDGKCKLDGTTTNVGAACTNATASVCGTAQTASCLDVITDDYPGGYCNVDPCTTQDLCPIGASCVNLNGETGQCFKDCSSDVDCRKAEGYFCLDMTLDDHPVGGTACSTSTAACWESGGSHKVCAKPHLICPDGPGDCPSSFPHCVGPDGGVATDSGVGTSDSGTADGALQAPPVMTCGK